MPMNEDLKKIVAAQHDSPHNILGPHPVQNLSDKIVIRAFFPHAVTVKVYLKKPNKKLIPMRKIHPDGIFEAQITTTAKKSLDYLYRVTEGNEHTFEAQDAYRFQPQKFDAVDQSHFEKGEHSQLYSSFGAHPAINNAIKGVNFCVWAPNAQRVSVVGNFNRWDGRCNPMQKMHESGIWGLFIPDVKCGDFYKFEIKPQKGGLFLKSDPYAFQSEDTPESAGIVYDLNQVLDWNDNKWLHEKQYNPEQAISVFQLNGATGQTASSLLDIPESELAGIKKQGYTHLELPNLYFAASGIATYFAPTPQIGTPVALLAFVDRCHQQGLGIIITGLAPHSKARQDNLVCFDGSPLYEAFEQHEHGNFNFDTNNPGVRSFFLSQIRFWLEQYHIDGFRLDINGYELYQQLLEKISPEISGTLLLVHAADFPLTVPQHQLHRLFHGNVDNPFEILGSHKLPDHQRAAIRVILPHAKQAYLHFTKQQRVWFELHRRHADGLWEAIIPLAYFDQPYKLLIVEANGHHYETVDIYALDFSHVSEEDNSLFTQGNHYRIYEKLGAHPHNHADIKGVSFAVWAPNAAAVSVVGPFNRWHGAGHLMKRLGQSGIWELFVPAICNGDLYKFKIRQHSGTSNLKSDPYAFFMEKAPDTASIVYQFEDLYQWYDRDWLQQRGRNNPWRSPISIYEVHLASWMKGPDNSHLNYKEIAQRIIPYVKEMGFTHIEVLPIAEHPYEPSWGYQVSNFYAPTSRLGKPEELMYFIDQCHQNGIGVILDWVAGHFPKDAHALAQFDGTHLFEHADPKQGEHKDWGTLIFNYGRHEVENFLIANALFWLEKYHFDGLRVDAVASMLYLDYSRKPGEWVANVYGGNENLEAIEFLKHTNAIVHEKFPGVLMIAEESTSWPGVSRPTDSGGLGFGFKWNMGWMHDVLNYMQTPPKYRSLHHHQLVFVFQYAFDENFILSLSHDEVVHLKGSLFNKMPGTEWEKYANLRLLFFFMFTHPGKKLNFMGAEFAQIEEWNESTELQWHLLDKKPHHRLKFFLQTLNHHYCSEEALYEMDCRPVGFGWIDADNNEQSIIAFIRKAREPRNAVIVVINFSAISRFNFRLGVPFPVTYTQILNSNDLRFGGFGPAASEKIYEIQEIPWHGQEFSLEVELPALSAILLKPSPLRS